jgi:peroxiredoxin
VLLLLLTINVNPRLGYSNQASSVARATGNAGRARHWWDYGRLALHRLSIIALRWAIMLNHILRAIDKYFEAVFCVLLRCDFEERIYDQAGCCVSLNFYLDQYLLQSGRGFRPLMRADTTLKKLLLALPWVMVLGLAIGNAMLLKQNLKLRSELEGRRPAALQPGERAVSFSAPSLGGDTVQINYTGKEIKRVLLYFTPDCPYCHEQFAYWQELLRKANRNKFQVIGIIAESEDWNKVKDYLQRVGCDEMLTVVLPREVRQAYKLSMTPTTLVIANDGTVENSWTGRWNSTMVSEASSVFGFQFSSN